MSPLDGLIHPRRGDWDATGQVEWKGRLREKMVGMDMNTLNVSEETGNDEKQGVRNEENRDLLNYGFF